MKKIFNIALILAFFLGGCQGPWENYQPPNPPPAEEIPEESEEPEDGNKVTLKVISIGINNQNADYTALEALIESEKADFVVIREADINNERTGIMIDQAKFIADLVGMEHVFAPQLDNYRGGQFGLAILSHFPISETMVKKLPVGPVYAGDERPFAMMKVEVMEGFEVAFVGVHIDDGSNGNRRLENRPIQARAILENIKGFDVPTIVAGNFFFQDSNDETMMILKEQLVPGCTVCLPTVNQHKQDFIAEFVMFNTIGNPTLKSYKLSTEIAGRKGAIAEIEYDLPEGSEPETTE